MQPVLIALALLAPSPKETLAQVRQNYQSLKTFQMRIVHHNSSGLFPGDYEQTLEWTAPKRFSLRVAKKADKAERNAPDYISDGINVSISGGSLPPRTEPINEDGNIVPGWEVSGGFILGWLMKTRTSTYLDSPPAPLTIDYTWGTATKWNKMEVKEIDGSTSAGGHKSSVQIFLSADAKRLLGWSYKAESQEGTVQYLDQKLDGVTAK